MGEQHFLLIPPTGLLEVINTDKPIDIGETLRLRNDDHDTPVFTIEPVAANTERLGRVDWIANDTAPVNPRAREALVMLCGIHMIFTGHVMFSNVIPPEEVYLIVANLSRKE
jgi:hypothetical protein